MPDLRVLYLIGNPVVKLIKNYRKIIISKCKQLKYLDDRPVFDDERRRVTVWSNTLELYNDIEKANEAERNEIILIKKEKDLHDERNHLAFCEIMKQGQEIRKQRELEQNNVITTTNINQFSGETIVNIPESEELKKIRQERWNNAATDSNPVNDVKSTIPIQTVFKFKENVDENNLLSLD
mmetsp:Transcript_6878/g.6180  ORF Transcript_6878/g.6180 Transcript_6878/m.6180 type:complete len:181 (+) Transcript_6878:140-682(+)